MQFKIKPYKHQLHAIDFAREKGDVGLLWEMGTGKTGGMINILRDHFNQEKRVCKTLILSPIVTLFNWEREFEIHSSVPKERVVVLHKGGGRGKAKTMLAHVEDPETKRLVNDKILITNYESLQTKAFYELIHEWQPEILICDESHLCKNPKAKRSKAVATIADRCKRRFIMTGTPILNNPMDIFWQFRILDKGETFGKNLHVFINRYMKDANAGWRGKQNYFPEWVPREDRYEELQSKVYTRCLRVLKSECLDLPPLVVVRREVELGKQQKKYYEQMKRDFITFVDEQRGKAKLSGAMIAQLAVTKALRLQQIVSGYAVTDTGEEIDIEDNPRLKVVEELLMELTPEHKVILWCAFRNNYKQLGKLCTKMNINHVFLTGEMNLQEKQEAMDVFNREGDCRVIIANRRAGGIGINLVEADYSIVYSRNFSLGDELQSEARNHRGGSEKHEKITKINLVARGTVDEHVLEALTKKQDISERIIDLIKEEK